MVRVKDSSTATERVGRYQLLEPIGGGPNGSVARAKVFGVAGFERQFAVKRFIPELTVGALAQALSAAARSYGSLEHPRIARMSEFGVAQGQTFTAVEYVPGLDVFRLLQDAKLAGVAIAAGGALALVSQAARAVGYAHGRGLSHLGLSPTNVIVTADGDVKVTDFGILAATMPVRPAESQRLASRVPYLAPEQISGEATSAASDVFVLGVIAYELVTGQRAYRGDSPAQTAQAILAGPPAEPPLPRPIVRVLQRCLARSPFERFPDARALADALDAALRVAPVPGTRKDVGVQVKTTLERYAALNASDVSGMVALNLHGAPTHDPLDSHTALGVGGRPEARTEPSAMPTMNAHGRPEARTDPSPMPVMGRTPTPPPMPPMPAIGRTPTPQAGATMRDMPKPFMTMPGLAPPPIPVPPGVAPPPTPTPILPGSVHTIPGLTPGKKPIIPTIGPQKKPPGPAPRPSASDVAPLGPVPTVPTSLSQMSSEPVFSLPEDDDNLAAADSQQTMLGLNAPAPAQVRLTPVPRAESVPSFDSETGEMSTSQIDALNRRAVAPTTGVIPIAQPDFALDAQSVSLHDDNSFTVSGSSDVVVDPVRVIDPDEGRPPTPMAQSQPTPAYTPAAYSSDPAAYSNQPAAYSSEPTMEPPQLHTPQAPPPPPIASAPAAHQSSRMPLIAGIILGIGVLGAGGYVAYNELYLKKQTTEVVASNGSSTGSAATGSGSAMTGSGSVGSAAVGSGSNTGSAGSGSAAGSTAVGSGSDTGSAAMSGSGSDAGSAAAAGSGAGSSGSGAGSGSAVVATTIDAGAAVGSGGSEKPPETKPTQASDNLQVASKPKGARVFIDGADQGTTPLKISGSADRHTLAVFLPGHELYLAEVNGQGVYDIALKPVTPNGGHAGIKVQKCKDKERYYVYVDGAPTGMTCPTERIDTTVGPHVVEVYDIVTETRRKFDIVVKDERLSVRVKIEN